MSGVAAIRRIFALARKNRRLRGVSEPRDAGSALFVLGFRSALEPRLDLFQTCVEVGSGRLEGRFVARQGCEARFAALSGDKPAFEAAGADFDARLKQIEAWLERAAESEDE